MGYAMNEYGREIAPEERKQKALDNAVSWWGSGNGMKSAVLSWIR